MTQPTNQPPFQPGDVIRKRGSIMRHVVEACEPRVAHGSVRWVVTTDDGRDLFADQCEKVGVEEAFATPKTYSDQWPTTLESWLRKDAELAELRDFRDTVRTIACPQSSAAEIVDSFKSLAKQLRDVEAERDRLRAQLKESGAVSEWIRAERAEQ